MTTRTMGIGAETTRATDRPSARAIVSRLLQAGSTTIEAFDLTGLAVGLGPLASGWSILEIERLRSRRHPDASGGRPA